MNSKNVCRKKKNKKMSFQLVEQKVTEGNNEQQHSRRRHKQHIHSTFLFYIQFMQLHFFLSSLANYLSFLCQHSTEEIKKVMARFFFILEQKLTFFCYLYFCCCWQSRRRNLNHEMIARKI